MNRIREPGAQKASFFILTTDSCLPTPDFDKSVLGVAEDFSMFQWTKLRSDSLAASLKPRGGGPVARCVWYNAGSKIETAAGSGGAAPSALRSREEVGRTKEVLAKAQSRQRKRRSCSLRLFPPLRLCEKLLILSHVLSFQ